MSGLKDHSTIGTCLIGTCLIFNIDQKIGKCLDRLKLIGECAGRQKSNRPKVVGKCAKGESPIGENL